MMFRPVTKITSALAAVVLIIVATSVIEHARADGGVPGSGNPPVPTDVYTNLGSDWGITTAAPAPGTSPATTAEAARVTADNAYGFVGGTITSTHLVLFSEPDYGEAVSEEAAAEDDATFVPLYMDHLAWLVVIRNASPPLFGPAGKSRTAYAATVAVLVDASTGEDIEAVSLPPGT